MDMGGLRPYGHSDSTTACGRVQIGLFKNTRQCKALSLVLLDSLASSPSDPLPRTTRKPVRWTLALNTDWNHPSRRVQDCAKAVTSQNQHQTASVIPTRLPGDVTQQRREPAEVPRATRGNQKWTLDQDPACLTNRKQVSQTKFLSWLACKLIWCSKGGHLFRDLMAPVMK